MKLSNLLKEFNAKDEAELLLLRTKNTQRRQFVTGAPKKVSMTQDECKAACDVMQLAYEAGYEERVLRYVTTTEHRDRYGDIVRAAGARLENYMRNPVIQFAHDYSNPPVGNTIHIAIDGKNNNVPAHGLFMDERVDPSGRSDLVFRMAKSGFMKACSIGFMPIDAYRPKDSAERDLMGLGEYGLEYRVWDFMEWSPCPVPANPNALQESIKALGKKKAKALFTAEDFNLMAKFSLFEAPSALDMFVEQLEGRVGKVYLFAPALGSERKDDDTPHRDADKEPDGKVGTEDQGGDDSQQLEAVKLVCPKCDKAFDHEPFREPEQGDQECNEDDKEAGEDQQGEEERSVVKHNHTNYPVQCKDDSCKYEFKIYPKGKSVSVQCPKCSKVFLQHAVPLKEHPADCTCPGCGNEMKLDLSLAQKSAHTCERKACKKDFVHFHCSMPDHGSNDKAAVKALPKGAYAKCTACGHHHALVPADLSDSEDGESEAQGVKAAKRKALDGNPGLAALVALLNTDLSLEYSAMVQYIQHAATVEGAQYDHIRKELEAHAQEEHAHALELANKIEYLGGTPTCIVTPPRSSNNTPTMLIQDAEAEKDAVIRYKKRIVEATAAGEAGLVEVLLGILAEEEEHLQDLITTLGIDVAAVQAMPVVQPLGPTIATSGAEAPKEPVVAPVKETIDSNIVETLSAQMEVALKAMTDDFSTTLRGVVDEVKTAVAMKKKSPFAPESLKLFDEVKI